MLVSVSIRSETPGTLRLLDATPQVIRARLLPEEVGDFDREFRQAMADATENLDLTEVLALLLRWQRVAQSSGDAQAHRRMLDHSNRLTGGGSIPTEPWSQTKARLGT